MKLTLRQLRVFAAIADAGGTTAAAERIALSQSATSAALQDLEATLETRLFDRVGARLVLNDVGRALLVRARAVIGGVSDIEREFRGGPSVTALRVGASTTIGNYLLPALVASYVKSCPQARVDVQIENTAAIVAAVSRLSLDLAFIEGPCHDAQVLAQPWAEDELVIVAAPGHPVVSNLANAARARVGVAALRQADWLLREPGSGTREAVDQWLLPLLGHMNEGMRFGGTEAIKLAVAKGLGLSCLSLATVQDWIEMGRLVRVPTTLPRMVRPLWRIHHRGKVLSPAAQGFAEHPLPGAAAPCPAGQ